MEPELPIAKVRNLLNPIVSYFDLLKLLDEDKSLNLSQQKQLHYLVKENYDLIQSTGMNNFLSLIKDDTIW